MGKVYDETKKGGEKGTWYFRWISSQEFQDILAIKEVKETANHVTEKTKTAAQGAARKGKETVEIAGKEASNFLNKMGKSAEKAFK